MSTAETATKSLNILCVGKPQSGKTTLVMQLTRQRYLPERQYLSLAYQVNVTELAGSVVYFHELSSPHQVYLQVGYDGMMVFCSEEGRFGGEIRGWLDSYASATKCQVYDIPLAVVVRRQSGLGCHNRTSRVFAELQSLVDKNQVIEWGQQNATQIQIKNYIGAIKQGKAQGLKRTSRSELSIKGFSQMMRFIKESFLSMLCLQEKMPISFQEDMNQYLINSQFLIEPVQGDENQRQVFRLSTEKMPQPTDVSLEKMPS